MLHAECNDCVHPCTFHFVLATMLIVQLCYRNILLMPTVVQGKRLSNHLRVPEQYSWMYVMHAGIPHMAFQYDYLIVQTGNF